MSKLNQIIAPEKGVKAKAGDELTDAYHLFQKSQPFSGLTRTYTPKEDGGEQYPAESTRVQVKAADVLASIAKSSAKLINIIGAKDATNCLAKANVVVDGVVLLADVPVTHLLFLEHKLTDWRTLVKSLPTLDNSESWSYDKNQDCFVTASTQSIKTKKVQKAIVLYNATPEHPAQTQLVQEDVVAGTWTQSKQSGALPVKEVREMSARLEALIEAVKVAREEANNVEVVDLGLGDKITAYLFPATQN